jgi:hypothetical protein
MLDIMLIALLCAGALFLNAHAARVADRSSDRRARLEERWSALILGERG